MDPSISVVLPIHNQERTLASLVWNVLDVADSVGKNVRILLVDDGSTDDTYDTACELSRSVPQVQVMRQPTREGFKGALERVRRETKLTTAIVHDGASPIDLQELAGLLDESANRRPTTANGAEPDGDARGSRRFPNVSALNARMQEAHGAITSFRWMKVGDDGPARSVGQALIHSRCGASIRPPVAGESNQTEQLATGRRPPLAPHRG